MGMSSRRCCCCREKNKAPTPARVMTPAVNVFWRVGLARSTCQPAECFPRELVRGKTFPDPLTDVVGGVRVEAQEANGSGVGGEGVWV